MGEDLRVKVERENWLGHYVRTLRMHFQTLSPFISQTSIYSKWKLNNRKHLKLQHSRKRNHQNQNRPRLKAQRPQYQLIPLKTILTWRSLRQWLWNWVKARASEANEWWDLIAIILEWRCVWRKWKRKFMRFFWRPKIRKCQNSLDYNSRNRNYSSKLRLEAFSVRKLEGEFQIGSWWSLSSSTNSRKAKERFPFHNLRRWKNDSDFWQGFLRYDNSKSWFYQFKWVLRVLPALKPRETLKLKWWVYSV